MTNETDLASWMKAVKAAARGRTPSDAEHEAAVRVFTTELSSHEQMALAREIFATRSAELCRAYRNLVDVTYGFRSRRTADGGRELVRTPCITFIVDKKWESERGTQRDQRLPRHLYAYWTVGGVRKLCAVPTDVEEAKDYAGIEPVLGPSSILVRSDSGTTLESGAVCVAFERSFQRGSLFILSCRHVFSPGAISNQFDLPVVLANDPSGAEVARTRATRGPFAPEPAVSMDAQLARVTSIESLLSILPAARISHEIFDDAALDAELARTAIFFVLAPSGPVQVAFDGFQMMALPWPGVGNVRHERLIRFRTVQGSIERGQSGSPVTTQPDGGTLIGMLIAKLEDLAYVVPVNHLLDSRRYLPPGVSESWDILTPDALEHFETFPGIESTAPLPTLPSILPTFLPPLTIDHGFATSVTWRLADDGIRINGALPEVTVGPPQTVERVWTSFRADIEEWARQYEVPIELIIATICTESTGNPNAVRSEPGFTSDADTPHRVSIGLMQTLISTARDTLSRDGISASTIDRAWLFTPRNSIRAGTAYIRQQFSATGFDPPKVACAYNAGSLRPNDSDQNRWKMRQFPIGTSKHADRFIAWFNDCFRYFRGVGVTPLPSFISLLGRR